MRLIFGGICLLGLMSVAAQAGGDGEAAGFEIGASFYAPSHNIYCNYYDAGGEAGTARHDQGSEIHCARLKPTPIVVVLTGHGKITVNKHPSASDMEQSYAEKEQVLAYGASGHNGIHSCTSTHSGMKCGVKGKGFMLSKKGVKILKINARNG